MFFLSYDFASTVFSAYHCSICQQHSRPHRRQCPLCRYRMRKMYHLLEKTYHKWQIWNTLSYRSGRDLKHSDRFRDDRNHFDTHKLFRADCTLHSLHIGVNHKSLLFDSTECCFHLCRRLFLLDIPDCRYLNQGLMLIVGSPKLVLQNC